MHLPPASSGLLHIQHGGTLRGHNLALNRPGFKFDGARVPQVRGEVCIYFAFSLFIYSVRIIPSMQDVTYLWGMKLVGLM